MTAIHPRFTPNHVIQPCDRCSQSPAGPEISLWRINTHEHTHTHTIMICVLEVQANLCSYPAQVFSSREGVNNKTGCEHSHSTPVSKSPCRQDYFKEQSLELKSLRYIQYHGNGTSVWRMIKSCKLLNSCVKATLTFETNCSWTVNFKL